MFNEYKFHHQSPISERNWHASNALHVARLVVFIFYSMTGIYFIKSKCKERIYVGSSMDIEDRLKKHKRMLINNKHHSRKLQNHCNKYGINDLEFVPMVIGVKPEELIQLEQDYIDTLKPYFNICPTAGSNLGFKHSEASKQKMSKSGKGKIITEEVRKKIGEANKGKKRSDETKQKLSEINKGKYTKENHPCYGKKCSKETKRKIREKHKGKHLSEEHKKKLSESHKGKNASRETKLKMSEARKGSKHPSYDHTIYHFYHPEHGEKFCTQYELKKTFMLNSGCLSLVINGKKTQHKKWKRSKTSFWKDLWPSTVRYF